MASNDVVMYDLVWVVNGRVKETVETSKPLAICKWKANKLRVTTHRSGLLQPRETKQRPRGGWN